MLTLPAPCAPPVADPTTTPPLSVIEDATALVPSDFIMTFAPALLVMPPPLPQLTQDGAPAELSPKHTEPALLPANSVHAVHAPALKAEQYMMSPTRVAVGNRLMRAWAAVAAAVPPLAMVATGRKFAGIRLPALYVLPHDVPVVT